MMTCVIPTKGERDDELAKIVEHLKQFKFDNILIVKDTGKMLYNRYIQNGDIIYTQDDDCLVWNVQELIDSYKPDRIVANYKPAFQKKYDQLSDGKICLVGYGAIFNPRLANDAFKKYKTKYPEDRLMYREADRIFTYLNNKSLLVGDLDDFPSAWQGMSHTSEHEDTLSEIIKRLKTL